MIPPLLTKELRTLGVFVEGEMPKMNKMINRCLEMRFDDFVNELSKDEKKEDQKISDRSLARALDPKEPLRKDARRQATKVERLLARFVIYKTYDEIKRDYPELTFERYLTIKEIDLLSEDGSAAEIDLWKLDGNWKVFVSNEINKVIFPTRMIYHGFDKPLSIELDYFHDRILQGTVDIGYSKKNSVPSGELRFECSDEKVSIVGRAHLGKTISTDELVLTGLATSSEMDSLTHKPALRSSAMVMERKFRVDALSEKSAVKLLKYHISDAQDEDKSVNKSDEQSSPENNEEQSSSKYNNVYNFLDRRKSYSATEFSPNTLGGLENFNSFDRSLERQFLVPQKPASYKSLKMWLSEKCVWFSISRISEIDDRLSLTRYEFNAQDEKRNFHVKRYNRSKNSSFVGFIDRIGWDIYILLRGKSENRNRIMTFDFKGGVEGDSNFYYGLGISKHNNQGLAWREILFRFSSMDNAKKFFGDSIQKDNLTYDDFLKLNTSVIDNHDKLYLASRNQSTLSFPTAESPIYMRYQRQIGALPYCKRDYFIYMNYPYSDKFDLFRVKLFINQLAQVTAEVKYPNSEECWKFKGDVTLVNDTLRISVFNPKRQQMSLLFNIHEKVIDRQIVLDGVALCTDKYGKSIAYTCVLVESKVKDLMWPSSDITEAGVVEHKSDEHGVLFGLIASRLIRHLEVNTIDEFEFKTIHPYERKDE